MNKRMCPDCSLEVGRCMWAPAKHEFHFLYLSCSSLKITLISERVKSIYHCFWKLLFYAHKMQALLIVGFSLIWNESKGSVLTLFSCHLYTFRHFNKVQEKRGAVYDKVMAIRKEIKQKKDKIEQLKDDAEEKATKAKVRGFFTSSSPKGIFLHSCCSVDSAVIL